MPFHWMSRGMQGGGARSPGRDVLLPRPGLELWAVHLSGHGLARHASSIAAASIASRPAAPFANATAAIGLTAIVTSSPFFLDAQTQMLIIKDFRTFRRDPAQWAQDLHLPRHGRHLLPQHAPLLRARPGPLISRSASACLTLTATSFLMCAYTGRFIFPMLSLEGSKFWILGLLPLDRGRLMIGKFVFSSMGCLVVGEFLIVFSNLMLGMPWLIIGVHMLTIGLLALGFSGMSVGLGACMPNFRETDPSKIAVGFGGTVNLVVGLLLLAVVIMHDGGAVAIRLRPRSGPGAVA